MPRIANATALAKPLALATLTALVTVAGARTPSGQWAIKPAKGQSQAQTQKDVSACQGEAQAHAGAAAAEQERTARQQSASQQVEQYNLAFRNCLSGRGYSVSLSQPGTPAAPAAR